jgi:hypothetical protein
MTTRTKRDKVIFHHAFRLKTTDRLLPAGEYDVVTDEELIEGVSFPAYRRIGSWILAPNRSGTLSTEMVAIDPADLAAAQARDRAALPTTKA